MDATAPVPVTDTDLAKLFASETMQRANMGMIRLLDLLGASAAWDLLPRVAAILWDEGTLEAHRSVFAQLCALAASPSDDDSLGRSEFSRGNVDEGPHAVAHHLLAEQQSLLQMLERWGHQCRSHHHLAQEGWHDYTTLRNRFFDTYFGRAAPKEQHKPSEQWMEDQWATAQAVRSGTGLDDSEVHNAGA